MNYIFINELNNVISLNKFEEGGKDKFEENKKNHIEVKEGNK